MINCRHWSKNFSTAAAVACVAYVAVLLQLLHIIASKAGAIKTDGNLRKWKCQQVLHLARKNQNEKMENLKLLPLAYRFTQLFLHTH